MWLPACCQKSLSETKILLNAQFYVYHITQGRGEVDDGHILLEYDTM